MSKLRIRLPSPTTVRFKRQSVSPSHLHSEGCHEHDDDGPSNTASLSNRSHKRQKRHHHHRRPSLSVSWDPSVLAFFDQCNQNSVPKSSYSMEGLDTEKEYLLECLRGTVEGRDSTSMFVLGPHGSGKTLLIHSVLETLSVDHAFLTFELNGLLYPDEKSAFKDFARQLRVQDDEILSQSSLSDTQLLLWLIDQFQSTSEEKLPWVIVLDEADQFTRHSRQSFLYALLDATTQRFSTPWALAVVGVSTALDLPQRLEKRVKSRFSQTVVHVSRGPAIDLDYRDLLLAQTQKHLNWPTNTTMAGDTFLSPFLLTLLELCHQSPTLTLMDVYARVKLTCHCTWPLVVHGIEALSQLGYVDVHGDTTVVARISRYALHRRLMNKGEDGDVRGGRRARVMENERGEKNKKK